MNESFSFSAAVANDRYRVGDLVPFPAGDNLILVYSKNSQVARFLRAEIVDLLMQCREFKTLDEHLQTYCHRRQASAATLYALRRELQKLVQNGYLVSRSNTLESLQKPVEQANSVRITTIGFPTCDRVEALQRGMTSYIENSQHFGRTNDFVVVDDSTSAETRDAYRHMLRTLKSRYSVNIAYAGLEEKQAFAKKLIEVGNVPADAVYFACMGDKQYGITTVGANRNALLLHTVGDVIFSADDDTLCQIAAAPNAKEGLALSSGEKLSEVWFFPDRESALQSVHFLEQDIIALHEQWLGQDLRSCIAPYGGNDEVSFTQAEPGMLRRLAMQKSRVVLTSNGTIGDCSWDNPHYHLFQRDNTFKRLTRSEQEYRSARTSREVAQVATQISITERTDPMFAMCIGLDNRELLPPFTPIGRAEEVAFGAILSKCFDAIYAVHLPWVLVHAPPEVRAFSALSIFGVGFNSWIPSTLNLFDPGFARTPSERLYKLGQYLEELGRLQQTDFEEFVHLRVWSSMSSLISRLEEQLQNSEEPPPAFWQQDVRALIALLRQNALKPVDQLYTLNGGREQIQGLLVRFGQVLEWWPSTVEAARRLRMEGYRLAQPI